MELKNYKYFVEEVLPQLGFAGVFDGALKTHMNLGTNEFDLKAKSEKDDVAMMYALKFEKKGGDYYFLNTIKATRTEKGVEPVEQTFLLYKQKGYNAQEMKNMLRDGGAVYRTFRKDGENVGRWTKLDLTKTNEDGNHPMRSFYDNKTHFSLAAELSKLPIIHANQEEKELLIKSLQSGERDTVTVRRNGQKEKMHIEATLSSNLGRLTLYNSKMEEVHLVNNTMQVVQDEKVNSKLNESTNQTSLEKPIEKLPETTKQLMEKIENSPAEGQQIKRKAS